MYEYEGLCIKKPRQAGLCPLACAACSSSCCVASSRGRVMWGMVFIRAGSDAGIMVLAREAGIYAAWRATSTYLWEFGKTHSPHPAGIGGSEMYRRDAMGDSSQAFK